ncbi:VanZ family protein [Sphingomicrobium lutaoense]|uniref:VanZ like family protein n=1 Tax=Sphingomicrobium lutaoense TaxID=515949 RepID=A0A839Z5T9_9SPHN|nr:VanZ family protein [Sphingomicrobium lutaoense]MBB3764054.1 hypothetical protein [Sphingomicrobium lutaoense]
MGVHDPAIIEKRLWWGALGLIAVIFSTTFFAGALAQVPAREKHLIVLAPAIFASLLFLFGVGRKRRALGVALALALLLVIGMSLLRIVTPAERSHLIEYAGVALLMREALRERAARGLTVATPEPLVFAAVLAVGIVDETFQWIMPHRSFDLRDIIVDAVAALLGLAISAGVHRFAARGSG